MNTSTAFVGGRSVIKYGRKVCLVPFEKISSIMASSRQQPQQTSRDDNIEVKSVDEKERTKGSDEDFKNVTETVKLMFPSKESFEKAMALVYMLKLDPAHNQTDKDFLLYTQKEEVAPPKNAVHLYHTLDVADVPLTLIGNGVLARTLKKMRQLKEDDEEDDGYDDEDDDLGEKESELLRKAWLHYVKRFGKNNNNGKKRTAKSQEDGEKKPKIDKKRGKKKPVDNGWIDLF